MAHATGQSPRSRKLLDQIQEALRTQHYSIRTENAYEGYEQTVDAHVKNLRKKLGDDPLDPRFTETVRGVGYRFIAN